jgi:hypothetical protein
MQSVPWLLDGNDCPLAPSSVLAELAEINPRLGLNYHKFTRSFMLTLTLADDDPRREMIRRGELSPHADFEILCPVPADVPLDELRSWCAGQLRRVGQSRDDIRRMVDAEEQRIAKQNAAVAEKLADEAREELLESIGTKTINVGKRRTRVK